MAVWVYVGVGVHGFVDTVDRSSDENSILFIGATPAYCFILRCLLFLVLIGLKKSVGQIETHKICCTSIFNLKKIALIQKPLAET